MVNHVHEALDPMHVITLFLATKTHLVKVIESKHSSQVQFKLECFPLPSTHKIPESDVLSLSHQSRVLYGPKLRQCTVVYESPIDLESGKMSFALCGLNTFSDGTKLEIREVCLEPDGNISFMAFGLTKYLVTFFCIGLSEQHGYGVGLRMNKQPIVFVLDYCGPGSFLFGYSILDHRFTESELVCEDFGGTAFFSCRSGHHTLVEMVDFTRDVRKAEGRVVSLMEKFPQGLG